MCAKGQGDEMSEGERAIVEKIAWSVSEALQIRMEKFIDMKIEAHGNNCQTVKDVAKLKAGARGFALAFALIGGFIASILTLAGRAVLEYIKKP